MTFTISRNELQAALTFASTDDARYVLTGINFELRPGAQPVLVTTDGRRLAVIESLAEQPEDGIDMDAQFILRPDFAKALYQLSKAVGMKNFPWIMFNWIPVHKSIDVAFVGAKCDVHIEEGAIIEGDYPNWRRMMPAKTEKRQPINDLGLNAEFIGDFSKVSKIMGSETPVIQMNLVGKDRAIEVRLSAIPTFYAMIMPCAIDDTLDYQPEFVAIKEAFPVKAEAEEKGAE